MTSDMALSIAEWAATAVSLGGPLLLLIVTRIKASKADRERTAPTPRPWSARP